MHNHGSVQEHLVVNERLNAGEFGQAIGLSAKLLEDNPDNVDVWVLLGRSLIGAGEIQEAITVLTRATFIDRKSALAWSYLGHAQRLAGKTSQASTSLSESVSLAPSDPDILTRLGLFQSYTGDYKSAVDTLRYVCLISPNQQSAKVNLGNALRLSGDVSGAIAIYESALLCDPNLSGCHWNRAMAILLSGDYKLGFQAIEARHQRVGARTPSWILDSWSGTPVNGALLVESEQGFGDLLQFARFFMSAAKRCDSLIVRCHPKMAGIMSLVDGVTSTVSNREEPPEHSARIQIFSLPKALGISEPNPETIPYIGKGLPPKERWLPPKLDGEIRVGIAWQGNPSYERDHLRSVELQKLKSLFSIEGVNFYSLQKYDGAEQLDQICPSIRPVDLGARLDNTGQAFLGSAEAMRELDLVISTDTSTVHLAGALGVPCWVMLPFAPDWRWGLNSEVTPWYPEMRLFRQRRAKDWSSVVDRVRVALESFQVRTIGE